MTAITPLSTDFIGTGTVLNPATGAAAGQVRWPGPTG
jgi:hypothetical protein